MVLFHINQTIDNIPYANLKKEEITNGKPTRQSKHHNHSRNSNPTTICATNSIVYAYTDENGVPHTATSTVSCLADQTRYLKGKGVFAIKCQGKVSAIIEPLPQSNIRYNL